MATVNTKRKLKSQVYRETVKPTVKKVNKILTSSASNDKRVKRLTKIVENHEFRMMNKTKKLSVLRRRDINGMLKSGIFSLDERKAVVSLIKHSKINTLNENTAKILDSNVSILVEAKLNDSILTEGFFGDIWDGLKNLGDKAKDALKSGWSKVKGIWSEFTDLVKSVVQALFVGIKKAFDKLVDLIKSLPAKMKEKITGDIHKAEKGAVKKEIKELGETSEFLLKYNKTTMLENDEMEKSVVSGNFTPEKDEKMNDKEVEAGFDNLEKIADGKILSGKMLNEIRHIMFTKPEMLNALIENKASSLILTEGGGFGHLESAIKNPLLSKVIYWAIQGIAVFMNPIGKIINVIFVTIAKKGLPALSNMTKAIGGPGVFAFAMLSGITGEVIETAIEIYSKVTKWHQIATFIPVIGPIFHTFENAFKVIGYSMIAYGVATTLYNVVSGLMEEGQEGAH